MEITLRIDTAELKKAVSAVARIIPATSAVPMFQFISLEIIDNHLKVTGSDGDIEITKTVAVEDSDGGNYRFCVKGGQFNSLLRSFEEGFCTMKIPENRKQVKISCTKADWKFPIENADKYPVGNYTVDDKNKVEVKGENKKIMEAIGNTLFNVGSDKTFEGHPLSGLQIEMGQDGTDFVGSCGKSIAWIHEPTLVSEKGQKILVSQKAAKLILATINKDGDTVLKTDGKHFEVIMKDAAIRGVLMGARFPDWKRVIPTDYNDRIIFKKSDMINALTRHLVMMKDPSGRCMIQIENKVIRIYPFGPDVEEADGKESIDISGECQYTSLVFVARDVIDICEHIDADVICISMNDETRPILLTAQGDGKNEVPGFLGLIVACNRNAVN